MSTHLVWSLSAHQDIRLPWKYYSAERDVRGMQIRTSWKGRRKTGDDAVRKHQRETEWLMPTVRRRNVNAVGDGHAGQCLMLLAFFMQDELISGCA